MIIHDFKFLKDLAIYSSNALAFRSPKNVIKYSSLEVTTNKIANYLSRQGISKETLVCTVLPNHLNWSITLALHKLGVPTMSKNTLKTFSRDVFPEFLISTSSHSQITPARTIVVSPKFFKDVEESSPNFDYRGYEAGSDLFRLFSTSGTTGETKYIGYNADEIINLINRSSSYDLKRDSKILSLYPFGSGQSYGLALKSWMTGKTFFSVDNLNPLNLKFIVENDIDTLIGSPIQISSLLDIQKQTGTDLPALKTIIMGGSTPSEKLIHEIQNNISAEVVNAYGSSEVGNVCKATFSVENFSRKEFDCIQSDVTLQIVDDNDQPLPAMSVGHIRYKRPGMATSYYNNPEATAQYFRDGFFYPGDLAYLDHSGRLVLQGRSNEVINLGGVKINPERIDAIALTQIGIQDCAAFAYLNEAGVEELAIALVVDEGFDKESFEIAMSKDSPYPIRRAIIVKEIPRNENGKILRNLLAKG